MFQKIKNLIAGKLSVSNNRVAFEYDRRYDDFDLLLPKMNNYFSINTIERELYKNEIAYLNDVVANMQGKEKKLYAIIPYAFISKYDTTKVAVFKDEEAEMFYVLLDGKKLYYHKGYTNAEDVQKSFTYISAEQDVESPHRYLDEFFNVCEGDCVADLGAAEGNFSLMVVDKVSELFIVESDEIWVEALEKTFEPWKNKVHIINKFVGSKIDSNTVTLADIFGDKKIDVIKMDIEGMEVDVLQSAEFLFSKRKLKIAVAVYHQHDGPKIIHSLFDNDNFEVKYSDKYMLFVYDNLRPPYFRKVLVKALTND